MRQILAITGARKVNLIGRSHGGLDVRYVADAATRARALLPVRLKQDEEALRAAGGTEEEVQALRREMVGGEAADRLAELDREEAAWQARLDACRMERSTIEADPGLDAARRAARLRRLLEDRFTANERLRVEAIEQMRQADSAGLVPASARRGQFSCCRRQPGRQARCGGWHTRRHGREPRRTLPAPCPTGCGAG